MTSSCSTVFGAAGGMPHMTQHDVFTHSLVPRRSSLQPVPPSAFSSPRASLCGLSCQQGNLDLVHMAQGSKSIKAAAGLFNT